MRTERPFTLVDAAKLGLYGGIAAVLISLIGMVDAFAKKDIIAGVISMSQVLLGVLAFTPALFAATRALRNGGKGGALVAGAVAGAVVALLVALLALSIAPLNLRAVFCQRHPQTGQRTVARWQRGCDGRRDSRRRRHRGRPACCAAHVVAGDAAPLHLDQPWLGDADRAAQGCLFGDYTDQRRQVYL
ncbi:MAG: hypothetical protein IPM07_30090 [Anaerolineales bacterium]|nr:hypothetical protein [Anaerolineales bacterium]